MSSPLFFSLLCLFAFFNTAEAVKCVESYNITASGDPFSIALKAAIELAKKSLPEKKPEDLDKTFSDTMVATVSVMRPFARAIVAKDERYAIKCKECCYTKTTDILISQGCEYPCDREGVCKTDFCNKESNEEDPKKDFPSDEKSLETIGNYGAFIASKAAAIAMYEKYKISPTESIAKQLADMEKDVPAELVAEAKKMVPKFEVPTTKAATTTTTTTTTTTAPTNNNQQPASTTFKALFFALSAFYAL